MCSVDPDELTEMVRATDGLDITSGDVLCRKCKEGMAEAVLRGKDPYCRDCFLSYFEHKFRSTIGKSKQIRQGDGVLVAMSGGASSTTLLHLIHSGLTQNSHKRLGFKPAFLHIDESCLYEESDGSANDLASKVCSEVMSLGYTCYVISIQQVMATEITSPSVYTEDWQQTSQHQTNNNNETLKKQLRELLSSCQSDTNRHDLEERLRTTLTLQCAQMLEYKKVFLANNSTTIAIHILSQVAIGRGAHLPYHVHFKTTVEEVEIYHPMREILDNEIRYYMKFHGVTASQTSSRHQHQGTSIIKCTEDFLRGLQAEFPSTIPTVFRTGDKLQLSTNNSLGNSRCSSTLSVRGESEVDHRTNTEVNPKMKLERESCVLCKLPLDTDQGAASALKATQVSLRLSQQVARTGGSQQKHDGKSVASGSANVQVIEEAVKNCGSSKKEVKSSCESGKVSAIEDIEDSCRCSNNTGCCSTRNTSHNTKQDEPFSVDIIEKHVCYGCRILLRDMKDGGLLPSRVLKAVGEQERRSQMRLEIQDFLL
ncbi:hypothetical protein Pmani_029553 [Petrolisthes manimaculis]|uniref:Cytoplasmic tRNA 2-thiolation protein 2 n=1 Tax=Petrolisthes manimaculis TaxID=1843537 RepID=A0AAE1NZ46_9EUCA|nr:hypothetical protein Pmani_029553 [Petrolisthes manimaculis]